jgi:hypothetical protein
VQQQLVHKSFNCYSFLVTSPHYRHHPRCLHWTATCCLHSESDQTIFFIVLPMFLFREGSVLRSVWTLGGYLLSANVVSRLLCSPILNSITETQNIYVLVIECVRSCPSDQSFFCTDNSCFLVSLHRPRFNVNDYRYFQITQCPVMAC